MTSHNPRKPFTVNVEADFSEDGVWLIVARLRFRDGARPRDGSSLLEEGRRVLRDAIAREGARGRGPEVKAYEGSGHGLLLAPGADGRRMSWS